MVIVIPFIALIPDLTMMLVNRVFFRSPVDVYMYRMKNKDKLALYQSTILVDDGSIIENEKAPLKSSYGINQKVLDYDEVEMPYESGAQMNTQARSPTKI